jgi:hypothetical protein
MDDPTAEPAKALLPLSLAGRKDLVLYSTTPLLE